MLKYSLNWICLISGDKRFISNNAMKYRNRNNKKWIKLEKKHKPKHRNDFKSVNEKLLYIPSLRQTTDKKFIIQPNAKHLALFSVLRYFSLIFFLLSVTVFCRYFSLSIFHYFSFPPFFASIFFRITNTSEFVACGTINDNVVKKWELKTPQ